MGNVQMVHGVITIVQESRFRLQDAGGRGYLFVLHAGQDERKLRDYQRNNTPVTVTYSGRPDAGAIAHTVQPATALPHH